MHTSITTVPVTMLKSYLTIALRSFRKNRLISFINIFGLGLSMTIGMMVMIRLQDQLSYDNFHPAPSRTFRVLTDFHKNTGEDWKMASTSLPLEPKIRADFNGIEHSVSIYPAFNGRATSDGKELYLNGAFTEPSFFDVFGFSLTLGNAATALAEPNSVVISSETAHKYFGNSNPVGKIFSMEHGGDFIITGVLDQPRSKSHIMFDALASMSSVRKMEADKTLGEKSADWYSFNTAYTYVTMKPGFTATTLQSQLQQLAAGLNKTNTQGQTSFIVQSIGDITPGTDYLYNEIGNGGSWGKFYAEMGMALIILLSACFNYTNLSIARALTRAKEVGVRKVTGATRAQIFTQYLTESLLLSVFALCFAWIVLSFIIRFAPFNDGYEFIPSSFRYNLPLVLWSLAFALFTGLMAGLSPAWIISSFKPLRVLKNLSTAKLMGKVNIRKALIVFQYSLSLVIIIFLLAFYKQFSYMSSADPGFRRDNVLVVPLNGINEAVAVQQLAGLPGVKSTGAMSATFTRQFSGMSSPLWTNNKADARPVNYYYADVSFIRNMDLHFVAGNAFPSATEAEQYILLNQQAAHLLGFSKYQDAVGQSIWVNDSMRLMVTGILKDFSYENSANPVRPLAIRIRPGTYSYLFINAETTDRDKLAARVNAALKPLAPGRDFNSSWLDDELAARNSQVATISLLGYLAFMAIAIASLGLLGLVLYTVEVKRKEISIRKIIGANEKQLVNLLSKGFIKLLFIAGFIAIPIGYTLSYIFLRNFATRTGFGFSWPMLCFLFLLVIGLFTIMSQTWRAAKANPSRDLRTE
ncbi:MAG: FtsX-like permease family protein [Chitinophagaceae bacterium]|nr:MAG: FtsX-like permease family protein [Chitinophagaceae bacterium]